MSSPTKKTFESLYLTPKAYRTFEITTEALKLKDLEDYVFSRENFSEILVDPNTRLRVQKSRRALEKILQSGQTVYGVTTGFGDSCTRDISKDDMESLQENLVSYLLCGTGPQLPIAATRASMLIRLKSLSLGYSGVSEELIDRFKLLLDRDWIPPVPRQGSLGASGDLVPLAYIARAIQGEGEVYEKGRLVRLSDRLKEEGLSSYRLKSKEALAIVNGTSSMAGLACLNLRILQFILETQVLCSAWLCLAVGGKKEAFSALVNEQAKRSSGQARIAKKIRELLEPEAGTDSQHPLLQDRYSLRCSPQILGPLLESLELSQNWLETEINSASDNPLISEDGQLAHGGNFYGGYLAQAMDTMKFSLGHIADLSDRQLMLMFDERSNRGLFPNLSAWNKIPASQRHLHHGLKGLHQSSSAIASEIISRSLPASLFSRSSESHNQDKVSLGMSAATQAYDLIKPILNMQAIQLFCLAQALDLRGIELQHESSKRLYREIRKICPFVENDQALDQKIESWTEHLLSLSLKKGRLFDETL